MKTTLRNTYNCDFCNKLYVRKDSAELHETMCAKNPTNFRPCFDCKYLKKKDAEVYTGHDHYYTGEPATHFVQAFRCVKKEHFMHTPQNAIKGNQFDFTTEEENNPMPVKCEMFEDRYESLIEV